MGIEELLPEIEGVSNRQIWYAEQLRHKYIELHEDRFAEIFEVVTRENDRRDIDYQDDYLSSFDLEFNDCEKAILFGVNAGGIIAILKDELKWD